MQIEVKWEVLQPSDYEVFDLEDLNVASEEEWDELPLETQKEKLQEVIDELVEPPALILDGFMVIK